MWIAERNVIKANNDEHAAMCHESYGKFDNELEARMGLVRALAKAIGSWKKMGLDGDKEFAALDIISQGNNIAEVDGVRWNIREF